MDEIKKPEEQASAVPAELTEADLKTIAGGTPNISTTTTKTTTTKRKSGDDPLDYLQFDLGGVVF